ncbi:putative transcription factor TGA like domain-containing protein [Helianthus annuus]|uniref:Transcription factor TGA like domain-containing protein n=2 Tax=Helianthus annuus TaxID=4232 RepID=A0A251UF02_HELAN|nr:putative transcription factor TGA like domain-containing protein [Helianthus annuus]KAJ0551524.1 putative transcription factor TGA like domain-containing protein [Helianthus annuus]KAJ0558581.1 putative transcription factor TGA like domain-containing protein [Helianthus annuus]KAJ0564488.1 putative transcription factor TGA like domain-containing protein [Helianthus annuus]KAJ0729812.1 putative transcription factor TGA like domain-containing protein [Helianthus annuus]
MTNSNLVCYINPYPHGSISSQFLQLNTLTSMDHLTQSQPDFHTFLRNWMIGLEHYLHQLLHHLEFLDQQDEPKLKQLIHQVMTHYHEYFLAKAQVYRQNVFLALSPPWFSSYERTFLWLAGFRPGLAIRVVKSCGLEFTSDQAEMLDRLSVETKDGEKMITDRLARLERQVVAPPMLALTRMVGKEVNGFVNQADTAVDRLAEDMEVLVECADYLRGKTVAKVMGILTTTQIVRFLAAMAQLQLRIRQWGQLREAEARGDANLNLP